MRTFYRHSDRDPGTSSLNHSFPCFIRSVCAMIFCRACCVQEHRNKGSRVSDCPPQFLGRWSSAAHIFSMWRRGSSSRPIHPDSFYFALRHFWVQTAPEYRVSYLKFQNILSGLCPCLPDLLPRVWEPENNEFEWLTNTPLSLKKYFYWECPFPRPRPREEGVPSPYLHPLYSPTGAVDWSGGVFASCITRVQL